MNLGKAFKEIREELGLTRPQVAGAIGVTSSALWKIEAGKTSPKEKTIKKLCQTCAVPMAYFYCRAASKEDCQTVEAETLSRLTEAIGQLESYQVFAQSGWIHEILYDLHVVQADLEGKDMPRLEDKQLDSWLGFAQSQ